MLRITSGLFRGKKICLPDETITRPTSAKARQALFNCLFSCDFNLLDKIIVDCFAGSGAVGLECLSRGAKHVFFIENNTMTLKILQSNINNCHCEKSSTIIRSLDAIPTSKVYADMIFLDPPYGLKIGDFSAYQEALHKLGEKNWISPRTFIIIETEKSEHVFIENYNLVQEKTYGIAKLSFLYRKQHELE